MISQELANMPSLQTLFFGPTGLLKVALTIFLTQVLASRLAIQATTYLHSPKELTDTLPGLALEKI